MGAVHGAAVGLKIVISAVINPPIPDIATTPIAISPLAILFQAHVAVAPMMASRMNVLTAVPCTVIVVLRWAPYTCSYPANISLENAGLLVATVKPPGTQVRAKDGFGRLGRSVPYSHTHSIFVRDARFGNENASGTLGAHRS